MPTRLGKTYKKVIYIPTGFLLEDKSKLFYLEKNNDIEDVYEVYEKEDSCYKTRHGQKY